MLSDYRTKTLAMVGDQRVTYVKARWYVDNEYAGGWLARTFSWLRSEGYLSIEDAPSVTTTEKGRQALLDKPAIAG
jgi:hypothetical protein